MVKSPINSGEAGAYKGFKAPDAADSEQSHAGAHQGPAAGSAGKRRLALIQVIEGEIIPRLLLAHRSNNLHPTLCLCPAALRWTEDPQALGIWFLRTSEDEILSSLRSLSESAEGREDVYYRILAAIPSALETLWEKGECSLEAMTNGLAALDHVLEELHRFERSPARSTSLDS